MSETKPVCSVCNGTHCMQRADRKVPCTHCPLPCDLCRSKGFAFCNSTLCKLSDAIARGEASNKIRVAEIARKDKAARVARMVAEDAWFIQEMIPAIEKLTSEGIRSYRLEKAGYAEACERAGLHVKFHEIDRFHSYECYWLVSW